MNPGLWLAALALAGTEPSAFPCDKLGGDLLEIYEGFAPAPAPGPAPVEVRRKAVLLSAGAPLVARTFALADPAAAAGRILVFRPYREGEARRLCTRGRSDVLFGPGDEQAQFLLRCLVDADGDGRYEGFARRVQLVRVPAVRRTPPPVATAPEPAVVRPLPRPVALVEKPGLPDPQVFGPGPSARMVVAVRDVSRDRVTLGFTGQVSDLPPSIADRFALGGEEAVIEVPMADGAVVPIAGTRVRFARQGSKWTAALLDGFGPPPRLLCSGSVAEVGDTFTVFGAGQRAIIARTSLPAPH